MSEEEGDYGAYYDEEEEQEQEQEEEMDLDPGLVHMKRSTFTSFDVGHEGADVMRPGTKTFAEAVPTQPPPVRREYLRVDGASIFLQEAQLVCLYAKATQGHMVPPVIYDEQRQGMVLKEPMFDF